MERLDSPLYFENVDLLRGFAAVSVFVYHVIEFFGWKDFPLSGMLSWFRVGWMGVDLFFVISGFVIGLSAFAEIDRLGTRHFRRTFLIRRLARIVPLHYLTVMVFVVFVSPEILFSHFWVNLFSHLVFVHNLSLHLHGAINGSNWSLATEMQFYLLMLIVAPWIYRAKWQRVLAILVCIAWSWRYGVTIFVSSSPQLGSMPQFIAATQLPGMLDEFVAGLMLARFVEVGHRRSVLISLWDKVTLFLIAAICICVTMSIFWHYASFWDYKLMVIFWRSLLALSFALVILSMISFDVTPKMKWLLSPFLYLGKISYGIYLWQLPVLLSLKRAGLIAPESALVMGGVITLIFSSASWHFFEIPIINHWKRRSFVETC